MASKTTKTKPFKVAYRLDRQGFERIVGILKEVSPDVKISVGCSDGSSIEFSTPDELLDFPNSQSRRIQSLSLRTPWGEEPHINVRFRSSESSTPIEYEISGDDKSVFYYSGKLDECVSTYRLWYTPFAFLDFTVFVFGLVIVGFVILLLWSFFSLSRSDLSQVVKEEKTNRELFVQVVFWLSFGSLFVLGAATNFFRNRLFPFANFLIGDGINRFERLEFRRRTVGVGFVLSVFASVVASLLMR
jgi:hypothetical protein